MFGDLAMNFSPKVEFLKFHEGCVCGVAFSPVVSSMFLILNYDLLPRFNLSAFIHNTFKHLKLNTDNNSLIAYFAESLKNVVYVANIL